MAVEDGHTCQFHRSLAGYPSDEQIIQEDQFHLNVFLFSAIDRRCGEARTFVRT